MESSSQKSAAPADTAASSPVNDAAKNMSDEDVVIVETGGAKYEDDGENSDNTTTKNATKGQENTNKNEEPAVTASTFDAADCPRFRFSSADPRFETVELPPAETSVKDDLTTLAGKPLLHHVPFINFAPKQQVLIDVEPGWTITKWSLWFAKSMEPGSLMYLTKRLVSVYIETVLENHFDIPIEFGPRNILTIDFSKAVTRGNKRSIDPVDGLFKFPYSDFGRPFIYDKLFPGQPKYQRGLRRYYEITFRNQRLGKVCYFRFGVFNYATHHRHLYKHLQIDPSEYATAASEAIYEDNTTNNNNNDDNNEDDDEEDSASEILALPARGAPVPPSQLSDAIKKKIEAVRSKSAAPLPLASLSSSPAKSKPKKPAVAAPPIHLSDPAKKKNQSDQPIPPASSNEIKVKRPIATAAGDATPLAPKKVVSVQDPKSAAVVAKKSRPAVPPSLVLLPEDDDDEEPFVLKLPPPLAKKVVSDTATTTTSSSAKRPRQDDQPVATTTTTTTSSSGDDNELEGANSAKRPKVNGPILGIPLMEPPVAAKWRAKSSSIVANTDTIPLPKMDFSWYKAAFPAESPAVTEIKHEVASQLQFPRVNTYLTAKFLNWIATRNTLFLDDALAYMKEEFRKNSELGETVLFPCWLNGNFHNGQSLLHWACYLMSFECAEVIRKYGAYAFLCNGQGRDCLEMLLEAAEKKEVPVLSLDQKFMCQNQILLEKLDTYKHHMLSIVATSKPILDMPPLEMGEHISTITQKYLCAPCGCGVCASEGVREHEAKYFRNKYPALEVAWASLACLSASEFCFDSKAILRRITFKLNALSKEGLKKPAADPEERKKERNINVLIDYEFTLVLNHIVLMINLNTKTH